MKLIYAVEAIGLAKVKVGLTRDLDSRLEAFQRMCPVDIKLLGARPGTAYDERVLHEELNDFRDRDDWYFLTDRVREVIARHFDQAWRGRAGTTSPT